jgi:hypothetical protein
METRRTDCREGFCYSTELTELVVTGTWLRSKPPKQHQFRKKKVPLRAESKRHPRDQTLISIILLRNQWAMSPHGGLSTGPKTESGLRRIQQALTKHGRYSKREIENRRMIRSLMRDARRLLREIYSQSRLREHKPILRVPRWRTNIFIIGNPLASTDHAPRKNGI